MIFSSRCVGTGSFPLLGNKLPFIRAKRRYGKFRFILSILFPLLSPFFVKTTKPAARILSTPTIAGFLRLW